MDSVTCKGECDKCVCLNQRVSMSGDTSHTYCMPHPRASTSRPPHTGRGHIWPPHSSHISCNCHHTLSNTTTQDTTNAWYKMGHYVVVFVDIIVIFTNALLSFPHPKTCYTHLHYLVWLLCKTNSLVVTHVCNK